ncbi:MAG: Do family serine endopeptidase [Bacteroidales bacterium]|nr:Do family serine endopeptidase [Bacteroidales bacterium]
MKRFGAFILAALLGSFISLAVFKYFDSDDKQVLKIEHENEIDSKQASFMGDGTKMPFFDFTTAAQKVMPAAVHIKSTQTVNRSAGRSASPFDYYMNDDIFKYFFGPQTPQQKQKPDVQVGTGSGVIVKENGYIITNNHVIDGADDIEITLHDNRTFKATVLGTDASTDLALLKIEEVNLPFVEFANSDDVLVGEWVLAVGNPFNLNSTVTAGIVSAKARNINILKDKYAIESFIQTDAAINPGNSGGALVNLNGELVGINTAIASPTGAYSGYGFAVPSNIVKKVIDDLGEFGVVQRGFIGVMIRSVDAQLAKEKELKVSEGVYVDSLVKNGSADEAGIKIGDVILEIESIPVKSSPELQEIIGRHKPGDIVSVKIDRKGDVEIIKVVLKNRNGDNAIISKKDNDILNNLGIEIKNAPKDVLKRFNLEGGVEITTINPGKVSKYTDIKPGFIVTKIDKTPIKDAEEFQKIISEKKGGVLLEGVYPNYSGVYYYAFGI